MKTFYLIVPVFLIMAFSLSCSQNPPVNPNNPETNTEKTESGKEEKFVSIDDAVKNALRAGDQMPDFNLPSPQGKLVKSSELLKESNLVVVFYRGDWCPYCNMYLKRLQDNLKEIKANGGELVAISIEPPDDSLTVAEKNKLGFPVLTDINLDLARKFGIVYELPPETDEKYKESGIDLVRDNGTKKPELPISATYIVNQEGEITYAFLNPDYKERLESGDIIKELKKIKK